MEKRVAYNTINREGQRFNSWLIVSYSHTIKKRRIYLCRCDCGKEVVKSIKEVVSGKSKSCGCKNAENHRTHSLSKTRVYRIWKGMKNRCYNPNSDRWEYYGGIGVSICELWKNSFEAFFNDMGHPPTKKHSIDRFPNNEGNYEPSNCRWATKSEQALNRRIKTPLPSPPNK